MGNSKFLNTGGSPAMGTWNELEPDGLLGSYALMRLLQTYEHITCKSTSDIH